MADLPPSGDDDRFAPHPGQSIDTVYVIARAVDLIGARPREVLGVMLLGLVVSTVLLFPMVLLDVFGSAGIEGPTHPARLTALSVLAWVCGLLLQAPLVGSAIEVHTTRRGLFLEFFRRGSARLSSLLVASLGALVVTIVTFALVGALIAVVVMVTAPIPWDFVALILRVIGIVALSVVAFRVITSFSLVVPVVVVERLGPGEALRRAWTLGWPNSFPMLMALILPLLLAQALLFITGFMPPIVMTVTGLVLGLSLSVYQSVLAPVAYVAIREYVDGLDPASLLARHR
ncbi:hypothetical protein [Paraliomyxa miuraensis]|uniref:hypothetical protein n=1 Tax=Paraliomyxa miuraensis TaxID=376150 RepID=UPI0022551FF4|nr:hypothetical protein [Paraliomyxa miuraensis]MCX4246506.1 hypothetical protein [Paraliomyxa miuraensis]